MDTQSWRMVIPGFMALLVLAAAVWMGIGEYDFQHQQHTFSPGIRDGVFYSVLRVSFGLLVAGLAALALRRGTMEMAKVWAIGGAWGTAVMFYWLIIPLVVAMGITAFVVFRAGRGGDTP